MENRLALSSDARSRLVALARAQPHRVGAWYLQQNPDVKKANMTPLTHWMQFGCLEGREPWEGAFRELLGPEPVAPPPAMVVEGQSVKRVVAPRPVPVPETPPGFLSTAAGPLPPYPWALPSPRVLPALTGGKYLAVIPTQGKCWSRLTASLVETLLAAGLWVALVVNNPVAKEGEIAFPSHKRLRIGADPRPFNYGALMNRGATVFGKTRFDGTLFLNDDLHWAADSLRTFLAVLDSGRYGALMPVLRNPARAGESGEGGIQGAGVIARLAGSGVVGIHSQWGAGDSECALLGGPVLAVRAETGVSWREDMQITHSDNALSADVRRAGYPVGVVWGASVTHWEKTSRASLGDPVGDAALFWRDYWPEILRAAPAPTGIRVHRRTVLERDKAYRVALVKLDHIGDIAMSRTAITRLQECLPQATFTVFCASWAERLFQAWGFAAVAVDFWTFGGSASRVHGFNGPDRERVAAAGSFDLAVDLRVAGEARVVLQTIDATYKAAYGDGWTWSLPAGLQKAMPHKDQLRLLVERIPVIGPRTAEGKLVGLNRTASARAKQWPAERWDELAQWLTAHGVPFKWYDETTAALEDFGETVRQECRVYVGHDTGPTHLVAEAGVPVVELIGGLVPVDEWVAHGHVIGLGRDMSCSPCYSINGRGCRFECLDVSVMDVLWGLGEMGEG